MRGLPPAGFPGNHSEPTRCQLPCYCLTFPESRECHPVQPAVHRTLWVAPLGPCFRNVNLSIHPLNYWCPSLKKIINKSMCLLRNCEVLLDQSIWRHDARIFVIFFPCFDLSFPLCFTFFFQYITPQGQGWTKTCLNLNSPEIQRDQFCQLHGPQIFLALRSILHTYTSSRTIFLYVVLDWTLPFFILTGGLLRGPSKWWIGTCKILNLEIEKRPRLQKLLQMKITDFL